MRRTLLTAALCGAFVLATYRWGVGLLFDGPAMVVIKPGDMTGMTSVVIVVTGVAWIIFRTAVAINIVAAMVTGAVARRAKQRRWRAHVARTKHLVDGLRVGHKPVRPDAVANRAA